MPVQLPVALHVFLVKEGKTLLLRRKNTGTYDGQWSVPAGRLDAGESATSGAIREAFDEVGVRIDKADLSDPLVMHHHNEKGERLYFFFKTTKWKGEPENREPEKCDGIGWYDMNDTSIEVLPHIHEAFNLMADAMHYCEYGFDE